jgi:hypothetical protein
MRKYILFSGAKDFLNHPVPTGHPSTGGELNLGDSINNKDEL